MLLILFSKRQYIHLHISHRLFVFLQVAHQRDPGLLVFCFLLCLLSHVKCLYIILLYLFTGYNKIYGYGYRSFLFNHTQYPIVWRKFHPPVDLSHSSPNSSVHTCVDKLYCIVYEHLQSTPYRQSTQKRRQLREQREREKSLKKEPQQEEKQKAMNNGEKEEWFLDRHL